MHLCKSSNLFANQFAVTFGGDRINQASVDIEKTNGNIAKKWRSSDTDKRRVSTETVV